MVDWMKRIASHPLNSTDADLNLRMWLAQAGLDVGSAKTSNVHANLL